MPSLDIATAQPCLQNSLHALRSRTVLGIDFARKYGSQWAPLSKKFDSFVRGRIVFRKNKLVIKAVVTLEAYKSTEEANQGFRNLGFDVQSVSSALAGDEHQPSPEEFAALYERERLRRMRISKANKGNTPWNKGRKHTPETLQRIREKTRLAMQDPKVKMKLAKIGHAQSKETRIKIGVGVRVGWERRREKLLLQETCHYDWQNLIAEAARRGLFGEEELQWDSYQIMNEQLELEWMQSVEERKRMRRPKGSKRAPKPLEQRRKISEAIAAKWADPEYRNRVYSGLAKYHGIAEGTERKPRQKPTSYGERRSSQRAERKVACVDFARPKPEPKIKTQRARLRRNKPVYKDPLVGSKLEMLKNIRAQRAEAESRKSEAIARAKVLIAEAETAAKALEEAAKKSPVAQASLVEVKKLIAEAIQSITCTEKAQIDPQNVGSSSLSSFQLSTNEDDDMVVELEEFKQIAEKTLLTSSKINGCGKSAFQNVLGDGNLQQSNFISHDVVNHNKNLHQTKGNNYDVALRLQEDNAVKPSSSMEQLGDLEQNGVLGHVEPDLFNGVRSNKEEIPPKTSTTTKKWVRGKLVEVTEGS